MEILVHYDYREQDVIDQIDVEALASFVLASENLPENAEASISFVDDQRIHSLNAEFRGIDRPTDVLSFECDGVDDDEFIPIPEDMHGPFELGDIFIAVDVAEQQAPSYGMTLAEELSLLITHGLLHICGYDHMDGEEAAIMEAREEELLSEFWERPFPRHGCAE